MTRCRKVSLVPAPSQAKLPSPEEKVAAKEAIQRAGKRYKRHHSFFSATRSKLTYILPQFGNGSKSCRATFVSFRHWLFDHSRNVVYNQVVRSVEGGTLTLWLLSITFPLYQ